MFYIILTVLLFQYGYQYFIQLMRLTDGNLQK